LTAQAEEAQQGLHATPCLAGRNPLLSCVRARRAVFGAAGCSGHCAPQNNERAAPEGCPITSHRRLVSSSHTQAAVAVQRWVAAVMICHMQCCPLCQGQHSRELLQLVSCIATQQQQQHAGGCFQSGRLRRCCCPGTVPVAGSPQALVSTAATRSSRSTMQRRSQTQSAR
jgi:hypothetical protein